MSGVIRLLWVHNTHLDELLSFVFILYFCIPFFFPMREVDLDLDI